ncbi:Asp-tRNA(Asn)/Glu-tRNA(Gln) amidotransferase subunit GatC [Patescibacteria group bacterium]
MTKLKLTKDEVTHVAKLAQLELTAAEIQKFQKQLSQILDYIDQLKGLKTEGVKPISQTTGLENVFRLDEVQPSLSFEQALSGAKKQKNNYFKVQSVFKKSK